MAGVEPPGGVGGAPPPDMDGNDQPRILRNEDPVAISYAYEMVVTFLQLYGWYLLLVSAGLIFLLYQLRPRFQQWVQRAEDAAYRKKYDSSTALRRQEAMEAARRKMQESHDAKAAKFAEEAKLREEKKRQEKIDNWEHQEAGRTRGNRLTSTEPTAGTSSTSHKGGKKKTPLRPPDYNPLTGTSGGACYRPSRRGGGTGGG